MTSPQSVKPIQFADEFANYYGISSRALIEILVNLKINLFIEAPVDKYNIFMSSGSEDNRSSSRKPNPKYEPPQYQKDSELIEYLCLIPKDYELILLKKSIRVKRFLFAGIYDKAIGILKINPFGFIASNTSLAPTVVFTNPNGYFCVQYKKPYKTKNIDMNSERERSLRVLFSELIISPQDINLIIQNISHRKPQIDLEPDWHLSSNLRRINELHKEIFGGVSNHKDKSKNQIKVYIEKELRKFWSVENGGLETKIREATYIILNNDLYEELPVLKNTETLHERKSFTKLAILNKVALDCWNDRAANKYKKYPLTKQIEAKILEFKVPQNFAIHGAILIRVESDKS